MKKLSFEDGHIVLRDLDGTLFWSRHWVDMKGSHMGERDDGGYLEVFFEGKLTQKSIYHQENNNYDI